MNEVGEVKWRTFDEDAATESVICPKFGMDGYFHNKLLVAEISESTTAIGLPRNGDAVADA